MVVSAGAAGAAPAKKKHASKKPVSLTIAYTAPVADQLVPLIGVDEGVFKKFGVNAKMTYLPQTEALDGLVGGSVQMAVFDSPAPEIAVAGGQKIKWIGEWEHHADLFLMGGPGIKSVKDLAGKAVAETVAGSTTAVLTQVALTKAGVLSSAHLQPVGNVGATLSAFQSGSVQATIAGPPNQDTLLSEVKGSRILVNYTDSVPWVGGGIAAPQKWTSTHRAATVDVLKALSASVSYVETHAKQSEQVIATATKGTAAAAAGAYKSMVKIMKATKTIVPDPSLERGVLKAIASSSPGAAKLTGADVVDRTYAEKALGKHGHGKHGHGKHGHRK